MYFGEIARTVLVPTFGVPIAIHRAINMLVVGRMDYFMVKEHIPMPVAKVTLAIIPKGNGTDMEFKSIRMGRCIKGSGKTEFAMGMEQWYTPMEVGTKGIG